MKNLFFVLIIFLCVQKSFAQENYVINLDYSKNRLENAKKQFGYAGVDFKRYDAVKGLDVVITDIKTKKQYSGKDLNAGKLKYIKDRKYHIDCGRDPDANYVYLRKYEKPDGFSPNLSAGKFGCLCSFRNLITMLVKDNVRSFAIFEDDIKILDKKFKEQLNAAHNFVPKNGFIYFDFFGPGVAHYFRNLSDKKAFIELDKDNSMIWGGHAIIWGTDAAQKYLDATKEIYMASDDNISKLTNNEFIKAYYANNKFIIQNRTKFKSDIWSMDVSEEFCKYHNSNECMHSLSLKNKIKF